jgi:uncharacterized protein YpbB
MTSFHKQCDVFGKGSKHSDKWWKAFFRMMKIEVYILEKTINGLFGGVIEYTPKGLIKHANEETFVMEPTQDFLELVETKEAKPKTQIKTKSSDSSISKTVIDSYVLYCKDKSVKEIAEIRKLSSQAIESHMCKCYEMGLDINVEKFGFTKEIADLIKETIEKLNQDPQNPQLKKIKDELPSKISYFQLNLGIANINRNEDD